MAPWMTLSKKKISKPENELVIFSFWPFKSDGCLLKVFCDYLKHFIFWIVAWSFFFEKISTRWMKYQLQDNLQIGATGLAWPAKVLAVLGRKAILRKLFRSIFSHWKNNNLTNENFTCQSNKNVSKWCFPKVNGIGFNY